MEEHALRMQFLMKIQRIFQKEFPDEGVLAHLFGSTLTGLYTKVSDIDICLTTTLPKNSPLNSISKVADTLKKYKMNNIFTIAKAKVPICKFRDPEFNFHCDINVNTTQALRNSLLIKTYVEIDERAKILVMMVKYWAKRRELNDAARGGTLSSYTWTLIVINFLQMRNPPVLPCLQEIYCEMAAKDALLVKPVIIDQIDCSFFDNLSALIGFGKANTESVGHLLCSFFEHFAFEFDFNRSVVSVRHGKYLSKIEKGWHEDVEKYYRYFCVEDPFCPNRNLANSADGISVEGIRQEMEEAVRIIHSGGDFNEVCKVFRYPTRTHFRTTSQPSTIQNGRGDPLSTSSTTNRLFKHSLSPRKLHDKYPPTSIPMHDMGIHTYQPNGTPFVVHPFYQMAHFPQLSTDNTSPELASLQFHPFDKRFVVPNDPFMAQTYEPISPHTANTISSTDQPSAYYFNFPLLAQVDGIPASGFSSPSSDDQNVCEMTDQLTALNVAHSPSPHYQQRGRHHQHSSIRNKQIPVQERQTPRSPKRNYSAESDEKEILYQVSEDSSLSSLNGAHQDKALKMKTISKHHRSASQNNILLGDFSTFLPNKHRRTKSSNILT